MVATSQKNKITLGSLARDYAGYNLWANKTLIDWLKTKPEELMNAEVASSFPSIRLTLIHICNTQKFWLSVLKQDYFTQDNIQQDGSTEVVFEDLIAHSLEFSNYVSRLSEHQLQDEVPLITPWFESNRARLEYIHHCMNHSTYHRGQVITIARNLGLTDPPMTDYNFYLLNAF
jgi:uncharacterized damage-inducible protein DinB